MTLILGKLTYLLSYPKAFIITNIGQCHKYHEYEISPIYLNSLFLINTLLSTFDTITKTAPITGIKVLLLGHNKLSS